MGFTLGEDRDEDVGACHFLAAGRLNVDHGALDDALEARRRLRFGSSVGHQVGKFGIDVVGEIVAQFLDIHAAGLHHGHGILVFSKREQKMFQRRELLAAFCGEGKGAVQSFFE